MGYALYRGAIRRERPAFHPAFRSFTNLNHFYPVAGEKRQLSKSRSTGFGSEQPEFAEGKRLHREFAQRKR